MAVNPIIESFGRDLVTDYCQGLECSAVYSAPPFFVETLPDRSNRSPHRLPFNMHTLAIISTFLTWHINIGLCLPKALTLKQPRLYKMFEVLLIVRINKTVGLRGVYNFHLIRDTFPYRLARGIPLMEGVL
jgi:hypothetical protein